MNIPAMQSNSVSPIPANRPEQPAVTPQRKAEDAATPTQGVQTPPVSQFQPAPRVTPATKFESSAALQEWVEERLAAEFGAPPPGRIVAQVCQALRTDPAFGPRLTNFQSGEVH